MIASILLLVSMSPTAHADDATNHGSRVSRDWKPSTQVVSNHVPWMKPSVHGSVRVLVVQPWQNMREVVELSERLEMTFEVIPVTSVGRNSILTKGMFDYEREDFERKLPNADVLIMCGIPPQWLTDELWQKMLTRVEAGMGLVWTVAVPEHERLTDLLTNATRTPSYLLHGAPYALLTRVDPYSAFRCTTRGSGRITAWVAPNMFRFGWATMTPVTSLAADEIYYGIVTRLVTWASGKDPVADVLLSQQSVELAAAKPSQVKLSINASQPISNATLIWTVRDASTLWGSYKPDGPIHTIHYPRQVGRGSLEVVKEYTQQLDINTGKNEVQLELPALPHGPYTLDARLLDSNQRAVDWDATALHIKSDTSIRWITLPTDGVSPTTLSYADIDFDTKGDQAKNMQLTWEALDSFGRLVARGQAPWNGQPKQRINFTLHHALAKGVVLHVSLIQEGKLISIRQATSLVTLQRDKPFRYGVYEPLFARMQDLEVDMLVTSYGNAAEEGELAAHDLESYFWLNGPLLYNNSKNPQIRTPCFNDPNFRSVYKEYLASITPMLKRQLAVGGLVTDEWDYPWNHNQHFTTRRDGTPGPLPDLCQCEFCLPIFKTWLKDAFNNNLSELNQTWGSSFESWDSVTMPKLADIGKTMNKTATAGRLRFGDFTTADFLKYVNIEARKNVPSIRLGLSGTRPTDGINGQDYWQISRQETGSIIQYGGPMTAQSLDFRKNRQSFFVTKWEGYSIWNSSNAGAVMWRAFIQGQDALIQYSAYPVYGTHQVDWTVGAGTKAMGLAFKEIDAGLSILMSNAARRKSPIAIHYSPESYALAATGEVPHINGTVMSKRMEELLQLLIDCGFDPIFLPASRIEQGALESEGCKLLILPDSLCLSDLEVEQIAQFQKAGGKVMATSPAGLYNTNGKKRDRSPEYQKVSDFNYLHTKQDGLGGEIDVTVGKTKGQLATRDSIARQLAQDGITPQVVIDGQQQLVSQIVTRAQGDATYYMIWPGPFAHDDVNDRFKAQVKITIPGTGEKRGEMYDLRTRKYIGNLVQTDSRALELLEGEPHIYAILPYKVTGLDLVALTPRVSAGSIVKMKATLQADTAGQAVDHAFEINITAPDGMVKKCYSKPQLAKGGISEWIIPLAFNDPVGRWVVHAQDVVSGMTQTAYFDVE